MKYSVLILTCLIANLSHAQKSVLFEQVYWNRLLGEDWLTDKENVDSAIYYFSQYVDDSIYSNAKDKLSYASCWLQKGNSRLFFEYAKKAILQGADPELFDGWLQRNKKYTGKIKDSVNNLYPSLRLQFWNSIDTVAYYEGP